MSKSYGNILELFGDEKATRKKIMSLTTDSTPVEDPKDPSNSIIVDLFSLVASDQQLEEMKDDFLKGGVGYGDFKKRLFESFWEYFEPMRARRKELCEDPQYIKNILKEGADRAREAASATLKRARHSCGITS
jgi:tryptophanyl-tRNA synthetase